MEYKKPTTSHFTESNAGHISVQTTSPFLNKIKDSEYKVSEQHHCKSKKNLSTSVLSKRLPKDASSGTSKLLINQILGDSCLDNGLLLNLNKSYTEKSLNTEKQCNYNQNYLIRTVHCQYSTPTFNSKSFSMRHGSCYREDSVVPRTAADRNVSNEINNATYSKLTNEKSFAEKTTYCRPSISYNQEFINKTVEKNNRLQRLVNKLILIRKKEKQTEAWNNYINELKNKHGHYDSELNRMIGRHTYEEPTPLKYIDDYYESQSDPCKDLLQDFYDAYTSNTMQFNSTPYEIDSQILHNNKSSPHQNYRSPLNHSNCFPISSQGRLMMLKRERRSNQPDFNWHRPASRSRYGDVIYVDKESTRRRPRSNREPSMKAIVVDKKCNCALKKIATHTSSAVQTDNSKETSTSAAKLEVKQEQTNTMEVGETFKDAYSRVSENVERLRRRIHETCSIDRKTVLESIEKKMDSLITSINSFIDEVKSKPYVRQCYDCRSVSLGQGKHCSNSINVVRSDILGLNRAEKLVCGMMTGESSASNSGLNGKSVEQSRGTNIDRILMKEMNSSNQTKVDIENMLSGSVGCPCSVKISIDIPTKDRSTEVTKSLEKTAPVVMRLEDTTSVSIEEIDRSVGEGDAPQMTIAVNTDPLGLLALLRVSKETVKQLLSYVPNIPYHSYILSMINMPQMSEVPHYICNICGAAFRRPSQLSDHIQGHDLGKTRDCCVCRHILDMQRHRPQGLFRCQYCGQRFARAYCCELHQESCARRFGRTHDVTPSLMLLR